MADRFAGREPDMTGPAIHAFSIIPDDGTPLPEPVRGLYVGSAGDVTAEMMSGGMPVTFANVPGGTVLPVRATKVTATGTTATALVGLV